MRKLNRLAAKATEYTGHVISLLASENAGRVGVFNSFTHCGSNETALVVARRAARSAPLVIAVPARGRSARYGRTDGRLFAKMTLQPRIEPASRDTKPPLILRISPWPQTRPRGRVDSIRFAL